MKNLLIIFSFMNFLGTVAQAEVAVQRTTASTYEAFQKYLKDSGKISFIQAFIHLSSVTELETPLLERCLEEVYLGAPSETTCFSAVKSLTVKPLNQPRREVLFSFLSKLEKSKSSRKSFYQQMKAGLLRTHEDLSKTFAVSVPDESDKLAQLQDLEMKAWKKGISKIVPLEEVALLINGKKVAKLKDWTAPEGVYQWTLLTNTHEPLILLTTFSQFAAESLKQLKPFATIGCPELKEIDPKTYGLLQLEVFSNKKCVAQFGSSTPVNEQVHLGNSTSLAKIEPSNRHWVWPLLMVVGVGVAASLKDKQITFQ